MADKQLLYFAVVGEEQSIARAAKRLNVASSAISRQISQLEYQLKVKLFDRIGRHIRLSREGEFYLGKVQEVLCTLDEAKANLQRLATGGVGHLKIGLHGWSGSHEIVRLSFKQFRKSFPECRLTMRTMTSPAQMSALDSGVLDAGFLYDRPLIESDFDTVNVTQDSWAIAAPDWHRLCALESVKLDDLDGENFVRVSYDIAPFERLENSLRSRSFRQHVVQETATLGGLMSLVAVGAGIAFINRQTMVPPGIVTRPITDFDLPMNLDFVWRRDNGYALLSEFVRGLRSAKRATSKLRIAAEHSAD